jgi:hypothetical protein
MRARLVAASLLALCLPVATAHAQNSLDTVERVIEVGGTIDRLAKARVAKGSPFVDVTFTTSHVGRFLGYWWVG